MSQYDWDRITHLNVMKRNLVRRNPVRRSENSAPETRGNRGSSEMLHQRRCRLRSFARRIQRPEAMRGLLCARPARRRRPRNALHGAWPMGCPKPISQGGHPSAMRPMRSAKFGSIGEGSRLLDGQQRRLTWARIQSNSWQAGSYRGVSPRNYRHRFHVVVTIRPFR